MVDGFGHRAGGLATLRGASRAQVADQVLPAPAADTAVDIRGDVRRMPGTQVCPAQFFRQLLGHQQVARRMAGAAVGQALRQVGAAVPFGAPCRIRLERFFVQKQQVPARHRQADIERERQLGGCRRGGIDRRHAVHEISVQRRQVGVGQLGVGRVGHGRIQMRAVGPHAVAHRVGKLRQRVAADAMRLRGRDIGGDNRAERRGQRQPACHRLAARDAVAGDAVAGRGQVAAPFDRGGVAGRSHRGSTGKRQQQAGQRPVQYGHHAFAPCSSRICWTVRSASARPFSVELQVPEVGNTPVLHRNRFA